MIRDIGLRTGEFSHIRVSSRVKYATLLLCHSHIFKSPSLNSSRFLKEVQPAVRVATHSLTPQRRKPREDPHRALPCPPRSWTRPSPIINLRPHPVSHPPPPTQLFSLSLRLCLTSAVVGLKIESLLFPPVLLVASLHASFPPFLDARIMIF